MICLLPATLPKECKIRKTKEYALLRNSGKTYMGEYTLFRFFFSARQETKMGITVSKKYGRAHQRNRFKRLCREAFRLNRHQFPCGVWINISPKHGMRLNSLCEIKKDIQSLITYLEKKHAESLAV